MPRPAGAQWCWAASPGPGARRPWPPMQCPPWRGCACHPLGRRAFETLLTRQHRPHCPLPPCHPSTHSAVDDLRLSAPWPELQAYADSIDLATVSGHVHSHIPYGALMAMRRQLGAAAARTARAPPPPPPPRPPPLCQPCCCSRLCSSGQRTTVAPCRAATRSAPPSRA